MTLRTDLLPVFHDARGLIEGLGLRPHSLTILTKTWAGEPGMGDSTDSSLTISPRPRVRKVSERDVASSGGLYASGDIRADRITPEFDGGGYSPEQLRPTSSSEGVEFLYVIDGPLAGDYALVDFGFDRSFGYSLILRRKRGTP